MVIEPAMNYRSSIKSFLANLKIRNVKFVKSIEEVKREMLTTKVGLFIVEWALKDFNGLQFCRELRQDPEMEVIPFLLITVENMRNDVILASEVGIDGYLLKPFSFEDFSEAINQVLKSKNQPNVTSLLISTGIAQLRERKYDEARSFFDRALEENPRSAKAMACIARVCMAEGNTPQALEWLNRAIQTNPDFIEGHRELVEIYSKVGPVNSLIEAATHVNNMSPDNPKYTLILAKAHLEVGNLKDSETYFKKTIRLSPKLAEAYKGLGQVNWQQEEYQSAMKHFRKALDLDSTDISILNSLGMAYVKLGHYKEGIEKYLAALKFSPSDARILFNLGYAKEKLGDFEHACLYYQQALEHAPNHDKARRRFESLQEKKKAAS